MVSLHKALSMSPKREPPSELQKKRKFEEIPLTADFFKDHKDHHVEKTKSIFDFELHLKTPFPSDKFQQYLTFQSRMNMKTQDSKRETETEKISLDLELNLTCDSPKKKEDIIYENNEKKKKDYSTTSFPRSLNELDLLNIESTKKNDIKEISSSSSTSSSCSPSWLSSSSSSDGDYKEMIATVCMRCHMLVMLCKSSPSCPNCKFMHPPQDQNPSKFLKRRRFSLLC